MGEKRGKIPATSSLVLESDESQWRMLAGGLINDLKTTALVELMDKPVKVVRIRLLIENIIPPEMTHSEFKSYCEGNNGPQINSGLSRISEYLNKKMEEGLWIFVGKITGRNETPVIITYYPKLKLFLYSQKLSSEKEKNFKIMPSLN